MMLQYSFKLEKEAQLIQWAVSRALDKGFRTKDIMTEVSTTEMGNKVIEELDQLKNS